MDNNTTNTQSLSKFSAELADLIEKEFFNDYGLSVSAKSQPVMKTNGERQGITVRFDGNRVSPTVYVEEAYQKYTDGETTIPEIVDRLCDTVYEAQKNSPELPELTPEEARKHITLTLVNTEHNQQLLADTPHWEILGGELSAIPRWYISDEASFIVKNSLCSEMGLTPEEVLQIGQQNINSQKFESRSMLEVLEEMMGPEMADMMLPMDGTPQMIVLTSENKIQGSNALLSESALDEVREKLEGDYVVLPSSIHEVICIPVTEDMKAKDLRSMVMDVNSTQVAPEERLSDQIFMYDGMKLRVVGDSLKMDTPKTESPKMESQHMSFAM